MNYALSSYLSLLIPRETILPMLDLSHNESTRLAVDCLLTRGVEGYQEVLNVEGEVDFLSELEKKYILENGRDGIKPLYFLSKSVFHLFGSRLQLSLIMLLPLPDVKWTDPVLSEPRVQLYFQSDSRGAGMKDVVREFIRKAKLALAIVMDSFSDVELLCDLLEASRKRNVSVHLLLDHLNLNLFVTMWQDLKLNSKNFPKLSVCSVDGQTYCAKTGRKLTGQIAESFIITDWTEVLTGSYSFSWLSWQVHRSLAVLVKGSAVTPFHEEFHRLYSSCKPVPGFVTFIAAPRTPPLHITSHAAQNENIGISKSKSSQTKTSVRSCSTNSPHLGSPPSSSPGSGPLTSPGGSKRREAELCKRRELSPSPIITLNCLKFRSGHSMYTQNEECAHLSERLQR
uniref:Family with sequence similarity 83 member A n=1 Tax=Seriola dumerili TaxID=41447 RepID=A0A3B4UAQ6_SERDU